MRWLASRSDKDDQRCLGCDVGLSYEGLSDSIAEIYERPVMSTER